MGILFECDMCKFRHVNDKDRMQGNTKNNYTLLCIRRAILDAFWSQDTIMVLVNFMRLRRDYFDSSKALIIGRPVPIISIDKFRDKFVMGCAIQTLDPLWRKGKGQDQLQWDSMRQTPTWYNNAWKVGEVSLEAGATY